MKKKILKIFFLNLLFFLFNSLLSMEELNIPQIIFSISLLQKDLNTYLQPFRTINNEYLIKIIDLKINKIKSLIDILLLLKKHNSLTPELKINLDKALTNICKFYTFIRNKVSIEVPQNKSNINLYSKIQELYNIINLLKKELLIQSQEEKDLLEIIKNSEIALEISSEKENLEIIKILSKCS